MQFPLCHVYISLLKLRFRVDLEWIDIAHFAYAKVSVNLYKPSVDDCKPALY